MTKKSGVTPSLIGARLVQAYVRRMLVEGVGDEWDAPFDSLLDAIDKTDVTDSEAICHMGRAMLCLEHGLSYPPYRLGGDHCDPALTEIAAVLRWEP